MRRADFRPDCSDQWRFFHYAFRVAAHCAFTASNAGVDQNQFLIVRIGVETMVQSNDAVNSAPLGNIDASFAAEAGNILGSI